MRKAINDNPMVQLAVIGVLLVGVGLLLATRMLKGGDTTPANPSTSAAASTATLGTATGGSATSTSALPTSTSTGTIAAPVSATAVSADALVPGPGLPRPVISAWNSGDAVVLLIVRGGGIDDRLVRSSVAGLSSNRGVSVFVARAKDIARYSRITQGVGVSQVPALVVVRPKRLSGAVPQAQLSYGFRDSKSVLQAVDDALYSGRDDIPYYPR